MPRDQYSAKGCNDISKFKHVRKQNAPNGTTSQGERSGLFSRFLVQDDEDGLRFSQRRFIVCGSLGFGSPILPNAFEHGRHDRQNDDSQDDQAKMLLDYRKVTEKTAAIDESDNPRDTTDDVIGEKLRI